MAVHTSTFGGVRLTGEDAKTFREQVERAPVNVRAAESLKRGRELVAEFKKHGFVRISPRQR